MRCAFITKLHSCTPKWHGFEATTVCIPHYTALVCLFLRQRAPHKAFCLPAPGTGLRQGFPFSPHTPFLLNILENKRFQGEGPSCLLCSMWWPLKGHRSWELYFGAFFFFYSIFKAAPEADVLSSIQTQLQMKRRNIGGQGPVRRSKNKDLRGGEATCEGNK